MTKWRYVEPGDPDKGEPETIVVTMTEREILDVYFDWWSTGMYRMGKGDLVSEQHCIEDWVTVHWADKVEA